MQALRRVAEHQLEGDTPAIDAQVPDLARADVVAARVRIDNGLQGFEQGWFGGLGHGGQDVAKGADQHRQRARGRRAASLSPGP
jgi:hypothetical protein